MSVHDTFLQVSSAAYVFPPHDEYFDLDLIAIVGRKESVGAGGNGISSDPLVVSFAP